MSKLPRVSPTHALAFFVVLFGCDAPVRLGQVCERTSQCEAPFVCSLGRCRAECEEHRDCPLESECQPVAGGGNVCRLAEDVCEADADCPQPLLCGSDGVCRAECVTDEECPSGSRCLTSGMRLLCVREDVGPVPDAGLDAGTDASTDAGSIDAGPSDAGAEVCDPSIRPDGGARDAGSSACFGGQNPLFDEGLTGWCLEASPSLSSPASRVSVTGGVATVALPAGPVQTWLRLSQELPLDESALDSMVFPSVDLPDGALVVAAEFLDASGALVARTAYAYGPNAASACDVTGRDGTCRTFDVFYNDVALDWARIAGALRVDLRSVVTVRRAIEVITDAGAAASVSSDGAARQPPLCPAAWWHTEEESALLYADLDHPVSDLGGCLRWVDGAAVRAFAAGACGAAIALDGTQWLESVSTTPLDEPLTIEMWWHPPIDALPARAVRRTLLWHTGDQIEVRLQDGALRAEMGVCAEGGGPALEVIGDALVQGDRVFQELAVHVDFETPRLCFARKGVLVGCTSTPRCEMAPPSPGGLRFGAGATAASAWVGAIDEIRVRADRDFPTLVGARTGRCYLDPTCTAGSFTSARDVGSDECVEAAECTSISTCPERARDAGRRCGEGTLECALGADFCGLGLQRCGGSGCAPIWGCADEVAPSPAACEL